MEQSVDPGHREASQTYKASRDECGDATLLEARSQDDGGLAIDSRSQSLGPVCGSTAQARAHFAALFLWFYPKCAPILHGQSWPHWAGAGCSAESLCRMGQ